MTRTRKPLSVISGLAAIALLAGCAGGAAAAAYPPAFPTEGADDAALAHRQATIDAVGGSEVLEREDSFIASVTEVFGDEAKETALGLGWLYCHTNESVGFDNTLNHLTEQIGADDAVVAVWGAIFLCPELVPGGEDEASSGSEAAEEPAPEPSPETVQASAAVQPIELIETAWGFDSSGRSWYAVIFDNPNDDVVFTNARLTIEAMDASGLILESDLYFMTILPGRNAVTGSFFRLEEGTEIYRLNVLGPSEEDTRNWTRSDALGWFELSDFSISRGRGTTDVSGVVTSNFDQDQERVEVNVIARNPEGAIIGADRTWVDRVPAGGGARFSTTFFHIRESSPLVDGTVIEAFANP